MISLFAVRPWLVWGIVVASGVGHAHDVTSPQARQETLLDYVAQRQDLTREQRQKWDRAVRVTFGGKALKTGNDEGITVAKSVIAGAIFFAIDPERGAKAAYQAYYDTASWVPPPLAINYQLLALQGRKPAVSAKRLAFAFPTYFNAELAPDIVAWWSEMLASGQVAEWEQPEIKRLLSETRALMRPLLLDKLWWGAELEARRGALGPGDERRQVEQALSALASELQRSFAGVSRDPKVSMGTSYYDRYVRLARELGRTPKTRPSFRPSAAPQAKAVEPPAPASGPEQPPNPPLADAKTAREQERRGRAPGRIPSPLPGDPLVTLYGGWQARLNRSVRGWEGVPYLWGGLTKRGVDCSAFVRAVYREAFNIELPRSAQAQYETGRPVGSQRKLKVGDLLFFDTLDRGRITHVGVYLGAGIFTHASSSRGVTRAQLKKRYYQRAYWSSRRLLAH